MQSEAVIKVKPVVKHPQRQMKYEVAHRSVLLFFKSSHQTAQAHIFDRLEVIADKYTYKTKNFKL